jgi:hypothetical protein
LPSPLETLAQRLRRQAEWCADLGSPLYASLLEWSAADLDTEGAVSGVLQGFESEPPASALALRFMASVHRLVLDDTLPELARHYPSTGGDGDAEAAWPPFLQALVDHRAAIRELLTHGCQTNEVGRSAALLGGFLEIAHRSRLSLRLLEIGASAGFNLRWDRYRYESTEGAWGDPMSPVRFVNAFDVSPPLNRSADVASRNGCDLNPIDPTSEHGALSLRSFVWADQLVRLGLLDGAIEVARNFPVEVEQLDASSFLTRELERPARGVATVVYHSVIWQYVDEAQKERILEIIADAKSTSHPQGPVFYLRMEPGQPFEGVFEIRLDGEVLGISQAHGMGVVWLVSSTA